MNYEFSDEGTLACLEGGCLDAVVFKRYTVPMPDDLALVLEEQALFILQGGTSASPMYAAMSSLDIDVLEMIAHDGYAPLKKDDALTKEYLRSAGIRMVHGTAIHIPEFTMLLALHGAPGIDERHKIGDLFYEENGKMHVAWLSDRFLDKAHHYAVFMRSRFTDPVAIDALPEISCMGMYSEAVIRAYESRGLLS